MVPEGWKVVPFSELAEFKNGLNFNKDDEGRTIKVVGIPDFWQRTKLTDFSELKTITCRGEVGPSHMLQSGDLLFVRSNGNPELVGRCLFFPTVNEPISYSGFTIRGRVDPRQMLPEFAAGLLTSDIAKEQIRKGGGGTNISNLSQDILGGIPVVVPPLPEQQKIAEILSTWDKAIETTEALLANARTQKRALMQSLLTGTRRFPGFEGQPWREVRLQQIADIIVSNVDKKSEADELPVRLCNYTDVYKNDTIRLDMDFMQATATPAQIKKFGLKVGDVIITKDSEDPTDIAIPAYVAETSDDLVCGYHLCIIRANDRADGRFLKYCFELPHTRYFFGARANGATRFGLNVGSIETAPFRVPSVEEQRAIADAILLIEGKISHAIRQLDHLRTEKKSLMQQLLTGKRRVSV